MTERTGPELIEYLGLDAQKWAQEFCRRNPGRNPGEDVMIGWFANAIMAALDHGQGPINGDHAQYLLDKETRQ
jgi:hypothetical protein